ncbi:MAG: MAPEG family protein [Alphaproteobacteria bacterium]
MTIPLWVLLGFALWTILILVVCVGVDRLTKILSGRARLNEFPGDTPHGSPRYRRAMRAHANCVENLPVYTALVVVITAVHATSPVLDALALALLGARILQTTIHVAMEETPAAVGIRFAFFAVQLVCMVWMGIEAGLAAA